MFHPKDAVICTWSYVLEKHNLWYVLGRQWMAKSSTDNMVACLLLTVQWLLCEPPTLKLEIPATWKLSLCWNGWSFFKVDLKENLSLKWQLFCLQTWGKGRYMEAFCRAKKCSALSCATIYVLYWVLKSPQQPLDQESVYPWGKKDGKMRWLCSFDCESNSAYRKKGFFEV